DAESRLTDRSAVRARFRSRTRPSVLPRNHLLAELRDRLRRIQSLRAGLRTIQDGMTAVEPERVLEEIEPFAGGLIARIRDPALCLQQRRRAHIALGIPPVARTRGRAAGAEDAFIESVELLALLMALPPFLLGLWRFRVQPRLDRFVLRKKV